LHVSALNTSTQSNLFFMEKWLQLKGTNPAELQETLLRLVDAKLTAQASMIAFEHIFMLFAATLALALPLMLLMPYAKGLRRGGVDH